MTLEERTLKMMRSKQEWPGSKSVCCLKKYPRGDEKPGFMGYSAFGVLDSVALPLTVHLRDGGGVRQYDSVEAAVEDGWVVD